MPRLPTDAPVTGLVLAAGGSTRLGQPKQLLPLGAATLLDATLSVVRGCGFDQIVVAVGGAADEVVATVDLAGVDVVRNPGFGAGCSSSIVAALPAVRPDAAGVVLMLGDQPEVSPAAVRALVAGAAGRGPRGLPLPRRARAPVLARPRSVRPTREPARRQGGLEARRRRRRRPGHGRGRRRRTGRCRHPCRLRRPAGAVGGPVTPTQLRAFATVVRLGSVKAAAADLGVSEAAVSLHVGQLRKELGDQLFKRTGSGLAFTPGGLRLASRAVEMLGLQDRTVLEVREAGVGRRMLRLATTSLFAEYAAPGLIGLFADRAHDLDVELSVHTPATSSPCCSPAPSTPRSGRARRPRTRRWPAGCSSTTRCSRWSVPDHPLTRGQPGLGDAARPDLAARPVRGRRRRRDPRDAAADRRTRGASAASSRATPPRSRRPNGVAA